MLTYDEIVEDVVRVVEAVGAAIMILGGLGVGEHATPATKTKGR